MAEAKQLHYMDKFKEHSVFKDIQEFDQATTEILYYFADDLNNTDKTILRHLAGCARNEYAIGVAYRKVKSIATKVDKSERTVRYSTKKLELLGILYKESVYKPVEGGNGSNAYVFTRRGLELKKELIKESCRASLAGRESDENIDCSKDKSVKKQNDTFNSFRYKRININIEKEDNQTQFLFQELIDYKHISMRLVNVYGVTKANEYWKRIVWAYRNSDLFKEMGQVYLQELLNKDTNLEKKIAHIIESCSIKHKNGNINKSFEGYLYKAMLELFQSIVVYIKESSSQVITKENDFFAFAKTGLQLYTEIQKRYENIDYGDNWIDELCGA